MRDFIITVMLFVIGLQIMIVGFRLKDTNETLRELVEVSHK